MNPSLRRISLLLLAFLAVGFVGADKKKITIYLIGDSTMSLKEEKAYPETGWGMPFAHFFDTTVVVDNRAKNGRSTRSFIAENRWQPVVSALRPGDYVFIQFGHNDESKDKGDRYTTPDEFKRNLGIFVSEAKNKGAIPVLLTPVSRRKFDGSGKALETHAEYAPLVRELAQSTGTALIDLDEQSLRLYQQLGEEPSRLLFNHLEPGEHPNYPDGKTDNTHFNELGARKIAQIVLKHIMAQQPLLAAHVVKGKRDKAK
jgi:lysophospholipase L1-like esterase